MKSRNRSVFVLLLLVTFAVVGVLTAQGSRRLVQVNLAGTPDNPTLNVTPERATICLTATVACPDQARWRAVGRKLANNESLVVTPKEGQPDCFTQGSFTLRRRAVNVDSGTANCPANSEWSYDVTLYRDGEAITVLDPQMIIDR